MQIVNLPRQPALGESLEETQATVAWLRNLHVWGIAIGLPVVAWLLAKAYPRRR